MRIRNQKQGNLQKLANNHECQKGVCTYVAMFYELYYFRLKIQPFVTEKSYQDLDGFSPWIRIRIEVKSWIRIRIESNTDLQHWLKSETCMYRSRPEVSRLVDYATKSLSQPLKAKKNYK
jgi:hypothetical protein